jgi:hypothetical protein
LFIHYPSLLEYLPYEGMFFIPQGIELPLREYVRIQGYLHRSDALLQLGGSVQPTLGRPLLERTIITVDNDDAEIEIAVFVGVSPGVGAEYKDPADGEGVSYFLDDFLELVFGNHSLHG